MRNLNNRINRLERLLPTVRNSLPPPPRVGGKKRAEAIRDYIAWLRRIQNHPGVTHDQRARIPAHIAQAEDVLENELERAEAAED